MNSRIYDINHNTLAEWHTPRRLRNARLQAWVKLLTVPFVAIYQDLLRFRTARLYELSITGQKCSLQRMLNDRYDFTLRRIYIDDGLNKPPYYIFRNDEVKPKFIYKTSEALPKWIYTDGESGSLVDDFVVFVPLDIVFELQEMTSLVKRYKLAGTKFKIQRF